MELLLWKVWCLIYGILSFFIIVVNILVLFIFIKILLFKCWKYIMVINFVVVDFSYGVLGLFIFIYYVFKLILIFFNVLIVFIFFLKLVCFFSVIVIVMDWMYFVVWLIYYKVISINVYKCVVMVVWIVFVGVVIFEMYNWGIFSKKFKIFIFVLLIVLLVVGIVIIGCYVCIWFKVRCRRKRIIIK